MYIAYYDESGDDGFPQYSSQQFALSALYLHYLNWTPIYQQLVDFRRQLKQAARIPTKWEFHTRHFVFNKKPYSTLNLKDSERADVIDAYCDLIGNLDLAVVNVSIIKPQIQNPSYQVLDTALKYSIQRIENDLDPANNPQRRLLVISDGGRVGKMRSTTRRIQRVNYVPSKYGPIAQRRDIRSLIEDPLPKDSRESYFIQSADLVSFVVYHYVAYKTGVIRLSSRLPTFVTQARVIAWMDKLKPSLNLAAAATDPYGVKTHP